MRYYIQHINKQGLEMWRAVVIDDLGLEVWATERWSEEYALRALRCYQQEVSK